MLREWGDRQTFLPRKIDYVASFGLDSRGHDSISPREATLLMPDEKPAEPHDPRSPRSFYHVLRSASVTVGGRERDCPTGLIAHAFERLILRRGLVEVEGQLMLHTKDNAAIEATYSGIARFFHLLTSFTDPTPNAVLEETNKVFLTIGFATSDQRYLSLIHI